MVSPGSTLGATEKQTHHGLKGTIFNLSHYYLSGFFSISCYVSKGFSTGCYLSFAPRPQHPSYNCLLSGLCSDVIFAERPMITTHKVTLYSIIQFYSHPTVVLGTKPTPSQFYLLEHKLLQFLEDRYQVKNFYISHYSLPTTILSM